MTDADRALSPLEYLVGGLHLALVVVALGFAAVRLRRALLPGWSGPPALVADLVGGLTLTVVLAVALGTFGAFTDVGFALGAVAVAAAAVAIGARHGARREPKPAEPPPARPLARYALPVAAIVCAAVLATWAIPTLTGVAGGMNRADSLWYHMPLSLRFAETGSTGGLHFFDPIFFAVFYPGNSEVLHAIPILSFGRDFTSPLLNLGFLALGLLGSWAIGRPYGVPAQSLCGGAVLLGAGTMVNFQGGEALNDIVGVALLLCVAALLVNGNAARGAQVVANDRGYRGYSQPEGRSAAEGGRSPGFGPLAYAPLAFAGAAAGLAAGTKLSFLAPVALLTLAVVVVAPRAARLRATAAWSAPMLLAGGYWYARNLFTVGNPIPYTSFGPLGLPAPDRDFELRPGFAVVHYAGDPRVWSESFFPALNEQLGWWLWPLVLLATVSGGAYAAWKARDPVLRALGAVAVLTAIAYVFTPLTAGGEEGDPIAFEWNIRYLAPAVAIALAILPCLRPLRRAPAIRLATLAALALAALVTTLSVDQWPNGGHTTGAISTGAVVLAAFAGAWVAWSRGWVGPAARRRAAVAVAGGAVVVTALAGFVLQRHYMERRYENLSPQLNIAEAVRWANDQSDQSIAISGVRGVFHQYAFTGPDLSNQVQWLGIRAADDAFLRIADCETWRAAVNAGGYDYVVTMYDPFLPGGLTDTKEALWTRADAHAQEVVRDGPVAVFRIVAALDPDACGDLPDLEPAELNGDSVNVEPLANQPPPGSGPGIVPDDPPAGAS